LVSSVTVRSAVISTALKSAVNPEPSAIVLPDQLAAVDQVPSASTVHVPLAAQAVWVKSVDKQIATVSEVQSCLSARDGF
ncbi:MAG: hypothetical protein K8R18_13265, partial [Parvibaculum sp.]|uniref:hypothetical protein n=1 Tax=Parvibaculum sp. TaxID=2024848 RepID=UPI0025F4A52A